MGVREQHGRRNPGHHRLLRAAGWRDRIVHAAEREGGTQTCDGGGLVLLSLTGASSVTPSSTTVTLQESAGGQVVQITPVPLTVYASGEIPSIGRSNM